MTIHTVEGNNKGKIMLYALSTCGWCKKSKRLLLELEVSYQYVDVDLQSNEDQDGIDAILAKYDPNISYSTIVINEDHIIKGFDPVAIRGEFE